MSEQRAPQPIVQWQIGDTLFMSDGTTRKRAASLPDSQPQGACIGWPKCCGYLGGPVAHVKGCPKCAAPESQFVCRYGETHMNKGTIVDSCDCIDTAKQCFFCLSERETNCDACGKRICSHHRTLGHDCDYCPQCTPGSQPSPSGDRVVVTGYPDGGWNGRTGFVLRTLVTGMKIVRFDDYQPCDAGFAPEYLKPVVKVSGQAEQRLRATLNDVLAIAQNAPELNMANYDEEQVSALNQAMIEVFQLAEAALQESPSDK